jgi:hypothetical protein
MVATLRLFNPEKILSFASSDPIAEVAKKEFSQR